PATGLCVAGVMGGFSSEVTEKTVNLLLESAFFNPGSIRKTAKALEMRTEASLRFERGIDPNGTIAALDRAAELIEALGAGTVARGYLDEYPTPYQPVQVTATYTRINRWLGTELSKAEIRGYLERVTFKVAETGEEQITVTVPTYRRDVTHMADLTEEVARLYGYHRIGVTLPASRTPGQRTPFQKFQFELRRVLEGSGLTEIITYSLNAKDTATSKLRISPEAAFSRTVDLMVPLSEDQSVMRTTLIDGMLGIMAFNAKRRQTDLAIYEIARVYWPKEGSLLPEEPLHLSIGLMGRRNETGWNQAGSEVDFYDLKGIVEMLSERFKLPAPVLSRSVQPFLHPGQSADVLMNGQTVGFMGRVHPSVEETYGLTKNAFIIELDLSLIEPLRNPAVVFAAPPKFPAVQRDLALVLPVGITSEEVIGQILKLGDGLVESVELFDVYQGEQVAAGQRSLAFSLSYRSKERTLSDVEVNRVQAELLDKLNARYGATIRG
ncbi:MAG TPA: phenylalanine--tRNA ligase subunit beta, partial [Bacillota bacterium]|nr:phenylalanine--tRNA ligase subunit beta [Bacillota bacterium]